MKKLAPAFVLLLTLCGCSTVDAVLHPSESITLNLASQLTTAEDSADIYVDPSVPYCDKVAVAGTLCKDRAIVKKMRVADTAAWMAIKTADQTKAQSDIDAAQSAIITYQNIVALVKSN